MLDKSGEMTGIGIGIQLTLQRAWYNNDMEVIKVNSWFEYLREHPSFTGCLIDKDNDIVWYKNGKRNREDDAALEWADGSKWWYKNGKKHREDGPAVEWRNGVKAWYVNGKEYSEQEWLIAMRKIKLERVLERLDITESVV